MSAIQSGLRWIRSHLAVTRELAFVYTMAWALCVLPSASCQNNGSGTFADSHSPVGPPDPAKSAQVWKVDPITGSVSITIPFLNVQASGRGPFYPYSLQYNSGSTFTLSSSIIPPSWEYSYSSASSILGYQNFTWYAPNYNAAGPPPDGITPAPWVEVGSPTLHYMSIGASYTYGDNPYSNSNQTTTCNVIGPIILMDDKGSHDLNLGGAASISGIPGGACSGSLITSAKTIDGSAMQTSWGAGPLAIYPDGTQFKGTVGAVRDSNGNFLSSSGTGVSGTVRDSLGRSLYSVTESTGAQGRSFSYPVSITTYTTVDPVTYSLTWGNVPYNFTFPQPTSDNITSDSANYPAQVTPGPGSGSVQVLKSVALPDGTYYNFDYDPTYGTIQKISLPTGGHVRFTWGIRVRGDMNYWAEQGMSSLAVTDVFISHGSGEDHWTYSCPDMNVSSVQMSCTVTDPQGNATVYTGVGFKADQDGLTFSESPSFHEISRQIYSAGTLIRTINTTYGGTGGSVTLPATVTTTFNDAAANTPNQQQVKYTYDKYDNVIEKDESDLYICAAGVCTPPGWLRKTFSSYYWASHSAYENAHIVDKADTVTITDGSGNPFSQTQYGYDEFPLNGSAGLVNHDDVNFPASFQGPRGNRTTEKHCRFFSGSTCAAWNPIASTYYDLAGQVVKTTDPNGNNTVYSYDSADGYPTLITRPQTGSIAHTDGYAYSFNTGEVTQHTDENGNSTTYSYADPSSGTADPFNRIRKITFPATADATSNTTSNGYIQYDYDDTPGTFAVTQKSLLSANGSQKVTKVTNYDSLGRVQNTQVTSDPEGTVRTDTIYDSVGRVNSISNPYRSSSDSTYGSTVFSSYDALGRKLSQIDSDGTSTQSWSYAGTTTTFTNENNSQWRQTTDGLGRLVKVLEPNGASQSASMETDYGYDVLNNLTTVTQWGGPYGSPATNGPISRSFAYNGLSWLIAANNPESASAANPAVLVCIGAPSGTHWSSCYSYDGNGNVVSKIDNRSVSINYSYDNLNRLVSKTYSGDLTGTLSSCYQYDTAVSPANDQFPKGHLTLEWTQAGSCQAQTAMPSAARTAKIILGHDAMGRSLGEQQCVASKCTSATPYVLSFGYDLAGNLSGLTNSVGAQNQPLTLTTFYDAAARPCLVTSSWTGPSPGNFAANLLQVNPNSAGYAAHGALQNYYLGSTSLTASSSCGSAPSSPINVVQGYTNRLWMYSISATGQIPQ